MPSKSNFYLSHSENSSFNRSTLDRTFLCGRFADRILVAEHANLLHLFGGRHGLPPFYRHKIFTTLRVIGELLVFMGVVSPGFSWANFTANGWAGSNEFGGATFCFTLPAA